MSRRFTRTVFFPRKKPIFSGSARTSRTSPSGPPTARRCGSQCGGDPLIQPGKKTRLRRMPQHRSRKFHPPAQPAEGSSRSVRKPPGLPARSISSMLPKAADTTASAASARSPGSWRKPLSKKKIPVTLSSGKDTAAKAVYKMSSLAQDKDFKLKERVFAKSATLSDNGLVAQ